MINAKTRLQRFLFANSVKSTVRHRAHPRIYDQGFYPMLKLSRGLKKFMKNVASQETVLDIGCGELPYKPYFTATKNFIGVDYYTERDDVEAVDIEKPFARVEADFVICSEVLEHSFHYNQVVENIYNNLKSGGSAYVTIPFAYEVHGWDYHDYFRYTFQALEKIFEKFSEVEIVASTTYPATLVQKVNNLIYYIPIPYILKVPFFFVNNLIVLAFEGVLRGLLKLFRIKKGSFLSKLIYSYPINYICYLKK